MFIMSPFLSISLLVFAMLVAHIQLGFQLFIVQKTSLHGSKLKGYTERLQTWNIRRRHLGADPRPTDEV